MSPLAGGAFSLARTAPIEVSITAANVLSMTDSCTRKHDKKDALNTLMLLHGQAFQKRDRSIYFCLSFDLSPSITKTNTFRFVPKRIGHDV